MNMSLEIKNRRLRWLGYAQRIPSHRIPKVASTGTQIGKGKRGRPKNTWRRTVIKELPSLDKLEWRSLIAALCPSRDEEDE